MSQKSNTAPQSGFLPVLFIALIGLPARGEGVRLNQIQVIGTHNSYHIAPDQAAMKLIAGISEDLALSLDYTHRPLAEQFSQLGIRQIELDVFADPQGGLFASPWGRQLTGADQEPYDPNGLMEQPGLKVLHVQDVDYRTRALTFVHALQQIRAWSQANPEHAPILVLIEVKDNAIGQLLTKPHPFGKKQLEEVDKEILSVFQRQEILKPDDVRGEFPNLRQAIKDRGWPCLDDVRGKVMFALDNGGKKPSLYLEGHPSLQGRMLFARVAETHPAAAYMQFNDPIRYFDRIQRMVKAGFLVRTRADAGTKEARTNDAKRRENALSSGAHFVSTDYPEPDQRFSDYRVRFNGGLIARANPVTGKRLSQEEEFDLAQQPE